MSFVRSLFSFTKKEVDCAFQVCYKKDTIPGLKLLQSSSGKELLQGKILIIIPKRVGNACQRNRLRRKIREIFYAKHFFEKKAVSVLLVYSEAKLLTSDQIEYFLAPHFQNQSIEKK
jgi:ribonuclease P protein component